MPSSTTRSPVPGASLEPLVIAGIVVAALGVGLGITGGIFGANSLAAADEISRLSDDNGTWSEDYESLYGDGQRAEIVAISTLTTAGAAAITSAILIYLGATNGAEDGLEAHGVVAPTADGLMLGIGLRL